MHKNVPEKYITLIQKHMPYQDCDTKIRYALIGRAIKNIARWMVFIKDHHCRNHATLMVIDVGTGINQAGEHIVTPFM